MNARIHQSQLRLRLLAGWCGLLLYVGAFSPIGMGAVAVLGAIDPDHHVLFQAGERGTRLVLHHEGRCPEQHHHGTLARMLTSFARPASNSNPDHVLQFGATTGDKRESQVALPSANQSGFTVVVFAEPVAICAPCPFRFFAAPRLLPDAGGRLLALRTTVLLI
jgi:hypothetical protein